MSKRPSTAAKRLTQANLETMGPEKLAALLMELGDSQPNLKRRLRMELAAEVGPDPLAAEIDKRLTTLSASKARVSWRKRADLILDLHVLRRMIAERLGALDANAAIARLLLFLDLSDPLAARVKDPKGELVPVFQAAAEDLSALSAASPPPPTAMATMLAEILIRARAPWSAWLAIALPGLGEAFSAAVLAAMEAMQRDRPALKSSVQILRVVADAAGNADAFIDTIPANLRHSASTGAAVAERLLASGRVEEAMAALKASDPRDRGGRFGLGRAETDETAINAWQIAYVAALEASGDADAAQTERWAAFEQTLSPDLLRAYLKRLADFDDVIATDKAFELAASHRSFAAGLAFLMDWPALSEAARMTTVRRSEIEAGAPDLIAWSARLEGRYPLAALLLLRAAIAVLSRERDARGALPDLVQEAEALASRFDDPGLESHESFVTRLSGRGRGGRG